MRVIDADAMEKTMCDTVQGDIRHYPYGDTEWDMAFKWIDHQPTIDAVPVVRCKDCKYFYGSVCVKHDGFMKERMQSDDFCSKAERKEE